MAIINEKCTCGAEFVVLTGDDSKWVESRKDGKQVIEKAEYDKGNFTYNQFRCDNCHEVVAETLPSAKYE